ncbi:MAG TPA: alpha/beta hydrolase [Thermomicrobiales bacterium]|nr:alpha/beta hydrolase [Thermomicrobiales bacterium]
MPSTSTIRQQLTVPGPVPIHVDIHDGEGPALVLIHGISGSGDTWLPVVPALGQHFTPVTIDLRGHGRSGKPAHGYLYDAYIGDFDRVLETLELEHPLILGHSLGGLIALWWAARYPARAAALVIEDSPLHSGEDFRAAFDNWIQLNAMSVEELRAHYAEANPRWKAEVVQHRAEQMTSTAPAVFSELRDDSMANHGVDRIAEIEHIESSALLIHGDIETGGMVRPHDALDFERRLGNAVRARIPRGAHTLHLDVMREFLDLAIPFLRRHADAASHIPGHVLGT